MCSSPSESRIIGTLAPRSSTSVASENARSKCFLRPIPLSNQDQIDTEIVVTIRSVGLVIGPLVISDRLLEIIDAFLRSFEKPASTGHVCVSSAEHVSGWSIANQLQRLLQIFQPRFVITFVNIRHANSEIRFGKAAPFATLTEMLQSPLSIVARNRILADASINAR